MNAAHATRDEYERLLRMDGCVAPHADVAHDTTQAPPDVDALFEALTLVLDTASTLSTPLDDAQARAILIHYAPTALIEGCWLWAAVQVERSSSALAAACMNAFDHIHGGGDRLRHRGNRYRSMLALLAIDVPELTRLRADPCLRDADFELALTGLRLGQRAITMPEALGAHAANSVLGTPSIVSAALAQLGLVSRLDQDQRSHDVELARACLTQLYATPHPPDVAARLWNGAQQVVRARARWQTHLAAIANGHAPSAAARMRALLVDKAPHAFGFHRNITLHGQRLDAAFDPARFDATTMLDQLARSPWIVPGAPDRSRLLTESTAFGGPMFGVFTQAELAVIGDWIRALQTSPADAAHDHSTAETTPTPPVTTLGRDRSTSSDAQSASTLPTPRALYRTWLQRASSAPHASHAHDHLRQQLAAVTQRVSLADLQREGLQPWSTRALQDWVHTRLHAEVHATPSPISQRVIDALSRDDTLWCLTQLAPAALIDGAWLAGATVPLRSHTATSALLMRIYRDELGAGTPHQHHGNVLRHTLRDAGVILPDGDLAELSDSHRFIDAAFDMPTLWLAFAQAHDSHLPELLGFNLAVEMAGIGRTYGHAISLLRRHAIDPYFFALHNTIDNAASGHTALSIQAIDAHMRAVTHDGDHDDISTLALRIMRGHALYEHVGRALARAFALRLGPRLGVSLGLSWVRTRLRKLVGHTRVER